jgi:hypothetical protein
LQGTDGTLPKPSPKGTPVKTAAGTTVELVADKQGQLGSVRVPALGDEQVPVLASSKGCQLEVYQIDAVLPGPFDRTAR